jgi:hypothetical protein
MQHSADFTTLTQYQADLDRAALEIERRDAFEAAREPGWAGERHARGFARLRGSLRPAVQ